MTASKVQKLKIQDSLSSNTDSMIVTDTYITLVSLKAIQNIFYFIQIGGSLSVLASTF